MSWPSAIWIEPGNSLKMMRLADVMTMSLAGSSSCVQRGTHFVKELLLPPRDNFTRSAY